MRIFVSHSSSDKAFVLDVVDRLPAFVQRWIDEEKLWVGMDLDKSIRDEIDGESDYLVAILSEAALKSGWVERELTWALEREAAIGRNFVLPVLLDAIDDKLPETIRGRLQLRATGQSRRDQEFLADLLRDSLYQLRDEQFQRLEDSSRKKLGQTPLDGEWETTFTWTPRDDRDSGRATDRVRIRQDEDRIEGKWVAGEYEYEFSGEILMDQVIGTWRSRKHKLFGVYHVRLDVETSAAASGYWIGNGSPGFYRGEWTWKRVADDTKQNGDDD